MKALIKVQLSKAECVSWRKSFVYTRTIQKESFLVKSNIHSKALVKVQKPRYRCFCSRRKRSRNNFVVKCTVVWSGRLWLSDWKYVFQRYERFSFNMWSKFIGRLFRICSTGKRAASITNTLFNLCHTFLSYLRALLASIFCVLRVHLTARNYFKVIKYAKQLPNDIYLICLVVVVVIFGWYDWRRSTSRWRRGILAVSKTFLIHLMVPARASGACYFCCTVFFTCFSSLSSFALSFVLCALCELIAHERLLV